MTEDAPKSSLESEPDLAKLLNLLFRLITESGSEETTQRVIEMVRTGRLDSHIGTLNELVVMKSKAKSIDKLYTVAKERLEHLGQSKDPS